MSYKQLLVIVIKAPQIKYKSCNQLSLSSYRCSQFKNLFILPYQLSYKIGIEMCDNIKNFSARSFKTGCHLYSRVGHRSILRGSNILVFGGTNYHNDFVTQILNISCESYEVTSVVTKNSLSVEGFSLHQFGGKIYFWGGRRPNGASNQLWKFQNGLYTKMLQKGQVPAPRFHHCSVVFAKKHMIIFGGMSQQQVFNDWFCLDLQTYTWEALQTNIPTPLNYEPKMVWLQTRGILLISQIWNQEHSKLDYCSSFYEFKIRKKQHRLILILQQMNVQFRQPYPFRGSPTLCKFQKDSQQLSLAIIGGQNFLYEQNQTLPQMLNDCWFVSLQTLQARVAQDVKLSAKYGHEGVFYKDRILLIGGVSSVNEFSCYLQTIDLKLKLISIDRKLCQACRSIYGLEDYTKQRISIKCQYQSSPKSYIPLKLVKKFAQVIQNPLKAFGLLIDNSLNMNANSIQISFIKLQLDKNLYKQSSRTILQICDNSYGFNREQILQSFFTFGYKIQTFTHDSKFQQQLAVRKQYGLNLKLSSIRLGKSCLMVANTIEDEKFIGFFSTDQSECPQLKGRFSCFYYFINTQKNISSTNNRHIIRKNIEHVINLQQIENTQDATNKIFILDFNNRGQFAFVQQGRNITCEDFQDQGIIFSNLKEYLQNLYLKPYFGRNIKLSNTTVLCECYLEKLKRYETEQKIKKIDLMQFTEQTCHFQLFCIYEVLDKSYHHKKVLIYSANRLIQTLDFTQEMICGVVQLKADVQISIGKCFIQNVVQEKQLRKFILKLRGMSSFKRKYSNNLKQIQQQSIQKSSKPNKKVK